MAVYKTKSGRWKAKINYRDDYGNVKTKEKTFDLKREAQDYESYFRKEIDSVEDTSITFDMICKDYLKRAEINANDESIKERKRIIKNFLNDFSGMKMSKISKKKYLEVFHKIATSDYSHRYKSKIITQMKSIADYAYRFHNIEDNTKTLPTLKKPIADHKEMVVWDVYLSTE